ncbi:MAG: hypothetical protein ACYTBZ_27805 [Planctomycetota bacterium]
MCKASNINAGTHTVKIYPILRGNTDVSELIADDTLGTRHPINVSSGATIDIVGVEDSYTCKGEGLYDIEVDADASKACVIDYVEVYGI